jgi:ABC-2 type transport system ATP-binding protein
VAVEAVNDGLLRVRYAEGQSPAQALVQAAVSSGWGLHQINPDQTSLEDVFVQLTYQEAAEQAS